MLYKPTNSNSLLLVSYSNYKIKRTNLNFAVYHNEGCLIIYLTVDESHTRQLKRILTNKYRRKVKKEISKLKGWLN
jgi:hypothetical protein